MELNTRCPDCGTVFPVSLEQLQLRKGYIRCVQCAHIFDGFEATVPATAQRTDAQGAPRPPAVEPRIPGPLAVPAGSLPEDPPAHQPFVIPSPDHSDADGPQPARPFSIGGGQAVARDPATPAEHTFSAPASPAANQSQEPRIPSVLRQRPARETRAAGVGPAFTISEPRRRRPEPHSEPELVPETEAGEGETLFIEPLAARRSGRNEPEFMNDGRRSRGWLTPVWAALILCGLVLLAVQGAYVYRLQLASAFPGLRPLLEGACAQLNCSVPYERHIEAIAITGSALRSSGPPQDDISQLVLEVTVRNTHERPQEWPSLVLDLKDAAGAVVVRRNLDAGTWVPAELRSGPFAAGSEIKVQLPVAVRGLQPNGYQLDKFFP